VHAFELFEALQVLKPLHEQHRDNHNVLLQPLLQTPIREWETAMNEILTTPLEYLDVCECYLLGLVKYQMEHQIPALSKVPHDVPFHYWFMGWRHKCSAY